MEAKTGGATATVILTVKVLGTMALIGLALWLLQKYVAV